jgi:hypothetical protein
MLEQLKTILQNPDVANDTQKNARKAFYASEAWGAFKEDVKNIKKIDLDIELELFPSIFTSRHIIDISYQTTMSLPSYRKRTVSEIQKSKTPEAAKSPLFYRTCMFSKTPCSIDLILCSNGMVEIRPGIDELNYDTFDADQFFNEIVPLEYKDILFLVQIDASLVDNEINVSFELKATRVGITSSDEEMGDAMQHWMLHIAGLPSILGKIYRLIGRYYDSNDASYKGISNKFPQLKVPGELLGDRTDLADLPKGEKAVSHLTRVSLRELLIRCLSGNKDKINKFVDIDVPEDYPAYKSPNA